MVHNILVAELASDDRETDCAEPVQRFSGRLDSSSRRSVCRSVLAGRTRAIAAAIRGGLKKHEDARRRGAIVEVLAPTAGGTLSGGQGGEVAVDRAITTMASVLYDAVVVACGPDAVETLSNDGYAAATSSSAQCCSS